MINLDNGKLVWSFIIIFNKENQRFRDLDNNLHLIICNNHIITHLNVRTDTFSLDPGPPINLDNLILTPKPGNENILIFLILEPLDF